MRGVKLPAEWVEKAEVFLREARRHLAEGVYWLACFESHQASELYLEALLTSLPVSTHTHTTWASSWTPSRPWESMLWGTSP